MWANYNFQILQKILRKTRDFLRNISWTREKEEKRAITMNARERSLKVEANAPQLRSLLGANESSQQAIPNEWKDMQMRTRGIAGNVCLPVGRAWARNNH